MKKVLDANYFRNPALETYLRAAPENQAVFTDLTWMEAYGGNAVVSIQHSIEIVSKYPSQVLVLKATTDIVALQDRSPAAGPREFIDKDGTREFAAFCGAVDRASADPRVAAQIRAHGKAAARNLEKMREEATVFQKGIALVARSLTPEHVRALRTRATLQREHEQEMVRMVIGLAVELFRSHPHIRAIPRDPKIARDTFVFRYALAGYLLAAWWISKGGADRVKPERLRNDVVDMNYVAHATFFDGLLSADKKMLEIYEQARFLLDQVFKVP
jgi:hypothetical protein